MTIQTTVAFRDAEPFRFDCATCGSIHDGIPSFGWDYPAQYLAIPEVERGRRVVLSDDACVIDDEWFFIRGCLDISVHGYKEPLSYGVWLSLSRDNFRRYTASFEDVNRHLGSSYFGWLCTAIPGYPDTQLLKTTVHVRAWPTRPFVELEATDHPLAVEQRDGVSPWRVQQIVERIMHPRCGGTGHRVMCGNRWKCGDHESCGHRRRCGDGEERTLNSINASFLVRTNNQQPTTKNPSTHACRRARQDRLRV